LDDSVQLQVVTVQLAVQFVLNTGSMQGDPEPQPVALVSMIVFSSSICGSLQSQRPANPPLTVLPSPLVQSFN
jgi:hypothetical protein